MAVAAPQLMCSLDRSVSPYAKPIPALLLDVQGAHNSPLPPSRFFLASLKSAMIKGCREPPYPSILTDATMEKLALAKFVAQESKREVHLSPAPSSLLDKEETYGQSPQAI